MTSKLVKFAEFSRTVEAMLPNDIPGHEALGKNFLRNMLALYKRNPGALDLQMAKIKEYLKQGGSENEEVKTVIKGLALTAESFGNPFFKALNEGKNAFDAHNEAIKEMAKFLKSKGLTVEELAEFDRECFKGSNMNFQGLAVL